MSAIAIAAARVLLAPSAAFAHVLGGDGGPGAGFMHPLTGIDHLLAMFTVGMLSASLGGRAIWTVPMAFVTGMIGGGALGIAHVPLPGTEYGIALSVVMLGTALTFGSALPTPGGLLVAAMFGAFHGHAHGTEMPGVSSPALYVLGFVAATAGLHLVGAISGLLMQCRAGGARRLRVCGAAISGAGLVLLMSVH